MDYEILLELAAEMGCRLMSSGAEIYRVEESMRRLLRAYGLETAEVFAIPAAIVVSVIAPDGRPVTRMRRIAPHGTDMELLERCNDLCRRLCEETPDPREAQAQLAALTENAPRYSVKRVFLGYALVPVCFAPLFGGGARDALCALVTGAIVGAIWIPGERHSSNAFFRTALCAAAASLAAALLTAAGLGGNVDAITVSTLMLLVPGLALTNAMREIMAGDIVSGLTNIAETILTAAAIALGSGAGLAAGRFLL